MVCTPARRLALPALALALVALPACDLYEPSLDDFTVILQVDDVPVDLGAGVSAVVRADRASATTAQVSTDFDVESVEEIESISLDPDMFTFVRGGAARTSGRTGRASGTITAYVILNKAIVPGMPVTLTIEDDVVTDVSPRVIASTESEIDEAAFEQFLSELPENERPDLDDWQSKTAAELLDEIREALAASSLDVTLGIDVTSTDPQDPLSGSITLNEIDVSATVAR